MFVTTYFVAVYFAARNKEDMIEGFFAGQFVTFSNWEKISINPLKVNFFFAFWGVDYIYTGDFFEITYPKITFPLLLEIHFSLKIKGDVK